MPHVSRQVIQQGDTMLVANLVLGCLDGAEPRQGRAARLGRLHA